MSQPSILLLCLIYVWPVVDRLEAVASGVYTDCSAELDRPTGIIQTPNFPGPFPSPISCQWVIKAPPHKKIILYFTQFYVRLSFHVAEFDYYKNDRNYSGLNELGAISFIDILTSLVAYKPYVVVSFMTPADISNINLRVDEYLLDVYGFNITYEVVDREQSVREHTCSVHDCSFLGNCLANADFSNYTCNCFEGYFGDQCQYGPYCDPKRSINMCKNGGQCRYLYGSLVNTCECPPEFEGPQCQFPKAHIPSECLVLGCSQQCLPDRGGVYSCSCNDGYKLEADNVTCVEKGRFRVVVGVLIHSQNNTQTTISHEAVNSQDFVKSLKTKEEPVKTQMYKVSDACEHWGAGVCDISRLGISSLRNTTGGYVLEFYFYCEKSDIQKVENGIRILVSGGSIYPFVINQQYLEIRTDPALHLLDVQNYDKRPAIQGKLLTLVCTARGSDSINFRWFKDGALVRADQTNRNAWEQRVPATVHEAQLDILNLENVTHLDKGLFTCEVTDYNEAENKTIGVDVIEPPSVEVNTLSATVIYKEPLSLNCLSPEDTRGLFKYAWYRGQRPLDPAENEEVVEDLVPTGVRLTMKMARMSANYSCVVTNEAGNSSQTISVYVITRNESEHMCLEDLKEGTGWLPTAPGGFDKHRCPTNSRGFTKRYCLCGGESGYRCEWSKVNNAGCVSDELLKIQDKIQSLLLGYQLSSTVELFNIMEDYMNKSEVEIYMGDLQGAVRNLYQLLEHTYKFKVGHNDTELYRVPLKRIIPLLIRIIKVSHSATPEEARELQIVPWFFRIVKLMASQDLHTLGIEPGESYKSDDVAFSYIVETTNTKEGNKRNTEYDVRGGKGASNNGYRYLSRRPEHGNGPYVVIKMKKNLLHIPKAIKGTKSYQIVTDLFIILPGKFRGNDRRSTKLPPIKLPVTLTHPWPIRLSNRRKTSKCVEWKTMKTFPHEGFWAVNSCVVLSQDSWRTTCLCPYSAFVAVALGDNTSMEEHGVAGSATSLLLVLACVFALCALIVTLIFHLLFYQNLHGDVYVINTNFVISLIVANSILLFCVYHPHTQVLCVAGRLLLYFFYLAAVSFLAMDSLHHFLFLYRNVPRFGFAFRYFILGWGIPLLFIVILVSLYVVDYRQNAYSCKHVCWVAYNRESSTQQFVAMIVPVSLMFLINTGLSCLSLGTLVKWKDEARHGEKRQNLFHIGHSFFILLLLLTTGTTKVYIENSDSPVPFCVFLFLNVMLGFSVLILRCFCDNQMRKRIFCSKDLCQDKNSAQTSLPLVSINSSTFSGYLRSATACGPAVRPGSAGYSGSSGGTGSSTSDYSRRKEHLLFLLGTNTTYNGHLLGEHTYNDGINPDGPNQRDTFLDSGIFEGSDPEKASSASSSLKEKGAMAQCDKTSARRSPRAGGAGSGHSAVDYPGYETRPAHRLSKCSDNSSMSNDTVGSIGQHDETGTVSQVEVDLCAGTSGTRYDCNYSEIIGTVSGSHMLHLYRRPSGDEANAENEKSTLLNSVEPNNL